MSHFVLILMLTSLWCVYDKSQRTMSVWQMRNYQRLANKIFVKCTFYSSKLRIWGEGGCDGPICDLLRFVTLYRCVITKCADSWRGPIYDQKCTDLRFFQITQMQWTEWSGITVWVVWGSFVVHILYYIGLMVFAFCIKSKFAYIYMYNTIFCVIQNFSENHKSIHFYSQF